MSHKVVIPEASTPDELRAAQKDAGWVQVAELASKPGFSNADWRMAMRAFRFHVDAQKGHPGARSGYTVEEVRSWFSAWYLMLSLRRAMALQDAMRRNGCGLPEEDEE